MSVLLLPLIIAVLTGDFVIIPSVNYSRPNIKFTDEAYIQADFGGTIKSYSNIQLLNQEIENKIDGPIFKSYFRDSDNNRLYEEFQFDFSFRTNSQSVNSILILLHFKYYIENRVDSEFKGVVPIFISNPSQASISQASVIGDLSIRQNQPIEMLNGISETLYNLNFTEQVQKFSTDELYEKYMGRNQTINYDYTTTVNSFVESTTLGSILETTTIHIEMGVPKYAPTLYSPIVLEMIKVAWIQYFALLVPIYIFIYLLLFGISVETSVFDTIMTKDCESSMIEKLAQKKQSKF